MSLLILNIALWVSFAMVTSGLYLLAPWSALVGGGLYLALQSLIIARMFGVYAGKGD